MSRGGVLTATYLEGANPDEELLPSLHHDLQWQRNDVRIFAHAAAETQVAIKDALASKFAKSGTDVITQSANDPGFLEVFPRVASRPPKLLQELEAILVDRLRANDKAASVGPLGCARDRDPKLSANLSLDGHRQVLGAFVTGFSTYAPLLSRIQAEFDRALNEGLRSAQENVEMRYAMARNELAREKATAEVRDRCSQDLAFRASALARLQELRDRAARAEKKKLTAEKDLREALSEQARMRSLVDQLRASNAKLTELLAEEDRWATKPLSNQIKSLKIGPLTKEDEAFLEQELGGMELTQSSSNMLTSALGAFSSLSTARAVSGTVPLMPGMSSVSAAAAASATATTAPDAAGHGSSGGVAAVGSGGAGPSGGWQLGAGSQQASELLDPSETSFPATDEASEPRVGG